MKRRNGARQRPAAIRLSYSTIWAGLILLFVLSFLHTQRLAERALQNSSADIGWGLWSSSSASFPRVELPDVNTSNGTIIVQLSGEMGNNLNKLAFGRSLQLMAKNDYHLDLQLVLRHQNDASKWISARRNLQKCFPNLRHLDFSAGNSKEYADRQIEQRLWLGGTASSESLVLHGNDDKSMHNVLGQIKSILQSKKLPYPPPTVSSSRQQKAFGSSSNKQQIRLPYVVADSMVDWHLLDRYRSELLEWLAFDYDACCPSSASSLPQPDESVFHFRNFVTELQGATSALGFDELSASRTATELFGHLQAGDKVAITTRFENNPVTQDYVQAMEQERGLQVRVISGNSATEDFCFLAKTKKELVGGQRSSFFTWAAYLGIASSSSSISSKTEGIQRVRSYSVNPPAQHQTSSKNSLQLPYTWNDQQLEDRWTFEVYQTTTQKTNNQ